MSPLPRHTPAFQAINQAFCKAYEQAKQQKQGDEPLLIASANELVLRHQGRRTETRFVTPCFDAAKTMAHAATTLFLLSGQRGTAGVDLAAFFQDIEQRLTGGASPELEPVRDDLLALSRTCQDYLAQAAEQPTYRAHFAATAGRIIGGLMKAATATQLAALHAAADTALGSLTPEELARLQVIVLGDHQARRRSFLLQYFCKRLGEREGEEARVAYAENASDEQGAIDLAATRTLDAELAQAFFGDPKRMQRDLLGDAAESSLAELPVGAHSGGASGSDGAASAG